MLSSDSLQLASATVRDFTAPRFALDSSNLGEWLGSLRAAGVRQSGPSLILALEGLRRADCSPSRRLTVLRLLKTPVLKTCAGLPKPWATLGSSSAAAAAPRGVTVEQRLHRLMFQNLKQALHQLDRCYAQPDEHQARRRNWAVRNLFRFFGRLLRYAVLWGRPLPVDAWRDLHDLYVYLMVRRSSRSAADGRLDSGGAPDAELEYKQLLLFGLAAQRSSAGVRSGPMLAGLRQWARQTLLEDPQGLSGECGLYLVAVSEDTPPQRHPGPLDAAFRGWVLLPPKAFFEQLELSARDAEPVRVKAAAPWPAAVAMG